MAVGAGEIMPFERVVLAYLLFLTIAAPFTLSARAERVRVALTAAACAGAVLVAMRTLPADARLWLALAYLPLGYWLPVPLARRGGVTRLERWLWSTDERFRTIGRALPRWLSDWLELGYLACYPLVPIAFGIVWILGTRADAARFWLTVISAGFACYGTLPWLTSRPPRLLEQSDGEPAGLARVNRFVLGRVSHDLVTFPSAHVAVALAVALAVMRVWWPGGVAMLVITLTIAVGAVVGRYHFAIDVLLGAAVGLGASQL